MAIETINNLDISSLMGGALGGVLGGVVLALGIIVSMVILAAFYVYIALALQTIAKKLKYKKSWLAWIPIANLAMILQIGRFHWAWIFLMFIPVIGWVALTVLLVIANWRIFEQRKYPGWYSLSLVLPEVGGILYLIAIGFVAWRDKKKKVKIKETKKSKRSKKK